jgi:hypothetical protein
MTQSKWSTRFFAWKWKCSQLLKCCPPLKIRWWIKYQERRLCQLTSFMPCSLFLIFWPLSRNASTSLLSRLHNTSEERKSHKTIWWGRSWFFCAWTGLSFHMQPHKFKGQLEEKNVVLQSSKYGNIIQVYVSVIAPKLFIVGIWYLIYTLFFRNAAGA